MHILINNSAFTWNSFIKSRILGAWGWKSLKALGVCFGLKAWLFWVDSSYKTNLSSRSQDDLSCPGAINHDTEVDKNSRRGCSSQATKNIKNIVELCNYDKMDLYVDCFNEPAACRPFMVVIWLKAWEIIFLFAEKEFPRGYVMTIYRRHQLQMNYCHSTLLECRRYAFTTEDGGLEWII